MKIAFVCWEYPPGKHGGIGTMVQVLGRQLVQAGHEVRVVGCCPHDYGAADYEDDQGVRVWRLRTPSYKFSWVADRLRLYRVISSWCREGKVDVVDVPDYWGLAAGWGSLRVPVVTRMNGTICYFAREMGQPVRRHDYWLERSSFVRSDFLCTVSKYTARETGELFGVDTSSAVILPNPVELPLAAGTLPRANADMVFTGTLAVKKGVIPLFEAWRKVVAQVPGARLHVYGKDGRSSEGGSMKDYLLSLLDPAEAASVRFYGHTSREQLFDALNSARAAVFPSFSESIGIAPIEAMARGCPTIFSSRSAGPEVIDHGVDGLLIDPARVDELAGAMIRLLRDDSLAARLAPAGREKVASTFAVPVVMKNNISFFERCIATFRSGVHRRACA